MKAVIYRRVSTEEQAKEGYSIGAQETMCKAFLKSQSWDLVDIYTDEGVSAKDTNRDSLKRMLSDAKLNKFDVIVVYRLDRLTRSVKDLYDLLETIETHGVKFKSVTEPYDTTTAAGKLFITLVAALAQWERENLAERVKFGMDQMFLEGKRPGAKMPYGYTKQGELIEDEVKILHKLRELYMEGNGFRAVANKLNEMGLLRNGKEWTSFTTYYTLNNPFYAGKMRWGEKKLDGKYASRKMENVVDVKLQDHDYPTVYSWSQYIEHTKRMKSREFNGYSKKMEYWFTGMIKCGKCGSSMTGRVHRNKRKDGTYYEYISYICSKRQMIGSTGCSMPMMRQELIEKLLLEFIRKYKIELEEARTAITDEQKADSIQTELDQLHSTLEKVRERRKRWQYAFVEQLITADELRERTEDDLVEMEAIESKIKRLELEQRKDNNIALDQINNFTEMWDGLDDVGKQQLLKILFKEIVVTTPLEKAKARKGEFIKASLKSVVFN